MQVDQRDVGLMGGHFGQHCVEGVAGEDQAGVAGADEADRVPEPSED